MVRCYNCNNDVTDHVSSTCPYKQQKTRCPDCDNVASSPISHKVFCKNKTFVSRFIGGDDSGPSTSTKRTPGVQLVNNFIRFKFRNVDDAFYVLDGSVRYQVGRMALRIQAIDAVLMHGDEPFTMTMAFSSHRKRVITFVNEHNTPIATFVLEKNSVTSGNRQKIFENGNTQTNYKAKNETFVGDCQIMIIANSDVWKLRIWPFSDESNFLQFDVHQDVGPVFQDAVLLNIARMKSERADSMPAIRLAIEAGIQWLKNRFFRTRNVFRLKAMRSYVLIGVFHMRSFIFFVF